MTRRQSLLVNQFAVSVVKMRAPSGVTYLLKQERKHRGILSMMRCQSDYYRLGRDQCQEWHSNLLPERSFYNVKNHFVSLHKGLIEKEHKFISGSIFNIIEDTDSPETRRMAVYKDRPFVSWNRGPGGRDSPATIVCTEQKYHTIECHFYNHIDYSVSYRSALKATKSVKKGCCVKINSNLKLAPSSLLWAYHQYKTHSCVIKPHQLSVMWWWLTLLCPT